MSTVCQHCGAPNLWAPQPHCLAAFRPRAEDNGPHLPQAFLTFATQPAPIFEGEGLWSEEFERAFAAWRNTQVNIVAAAPLSQAHPWAPQYIPVTDLWFIGQQLSHERGVRMYPVGHLDVEGRVTFVSPETYPGLEQEAQRIEQERMAVTMRTLAAFDEARRFKQELEEDGAILRAQLGV